MNLISFELKHLGDTLFDVRNMKLRIKEAASRGVLQKRCSYKFRKIHRKTPVPESLFNKVADLRPETLLKKETLAQLFSCEFCKISNNTYCYRTLW